MEDKGAEKAGIASFSVFLHGSVLSLSNSRASLAVYFSTGCSGDSAVPLDMTLTTSVYKTPPSFLACFFPSLLPFLFTKCGVSSPHFTLCCKGCTKSGSCSLWKVTAKIVCIQHELGASGCQ